MKILAMQRAEPITPEDIRQGDKGGEKVSMARVQTEDIYEFTVEDRIMLRK